MSEGLPESNIGRHGEFWNEMEKALTEREEMIRWLYSLENLGIKLGLENMSRLLEKLGNPHRSFKSIHVAGTNGKGSTSAFIASILASEGYRTALYTSPHLVELEERIKVDGRQISSDELLETAAEVRKAAEELFTGDRRQITFFEILTAIAFLFFSREKVEYAVVEVGLGGRLDATNVVQPVVSVITHVALEHTELLGNSLGSIAFEKGGIIKPGIPVITAESNQEALGKLVSLASERGSDISMLKDIVSVKPVANRWGELRVDISGMTDYSDVRSGLWGTYQLENIGLAVAVAERLQQLGVYLGDISIRKGIENVSWRGRLQIAAKEKEFVFDSAHNPDAMSALTASIRDASSEDFLCVIGILSDKNMEEMMPHIRRLSTDVICVSPRTKRARPAEQVMENARRNGLTGITAGTVGGGMEAALRETSGRKVIVTGSMRTVGEAMEWWHAKYGEKIWT